MGPINLDLVGCRELAGLLVRTKGSEYITSLYGGHTSAYFDPDGNPLDLVGHVLYCAGVEPFYYYGEENFSNLVDLAIDEDPYFRGEPVVLGYLGTMQFSQDRFDTWGQSLSAAERYLRVNHPEEITPNVAVELLQELEGKPREDWIAAGIRRGPTRSGSTRD